MDPVSTTYTWHSAVVKAKDINGLRVKRWMETGLGFLIANHRQHEATGTCRKKYVALAPMPCHEANFVQAKATSQQGSEPEAQSQTISVST